MADIAMVFHWPPDTMDRMTVSELARWQALAVDRWNAVNRQE